MEVTGTQVGIELRAIRLQSPDQRQFAVNLQSRETIPDHNTSFLELFTPSKICFFIKAGFDFNKSVHLLTRFDSIDQCFHDPAVGGNTILDNLYMGDIWVLSSMFEKFYNRFVLMIGNMYQVVICPNGFKNGFRICERLIIHWW